MRAVVALLAVFPAFVASVPEILSSSDMDDLARAGALSGTIMMKMSATPAIQTLDGDGDEEAPDFAAGARTLASAMACATPRRVFKAVGGEREAAHVAAGLDRWFSAACVDENQVVEMADTAKRSEAVASGAAVAAAFAALERSPMAMSSASDVERLEPGLVKAFEGFLPEDYDGPRDAFLRRRLDAVPDDPRYGEQTNYAIMDVEGAWDLLPTGGSPDVVVQVVDTGLYMTHEEFADNLWSNGGEICGNGLDDDGNGYVDDCHGYNFANDAGSDDDLYGGHYHGTHCAGTIAAARNNGVGIAGVCGGDGSAGTGCRVMVATCFGYESAVGGFGDAILYGADNGAHISSNSWGYTAPDVFEQAELDAIDYANERGLLVVFAAGNSGADAPYYPAYYAGAVAVAAVNDAGAAASFTNYGDWIDVSAPGVGVLSTWSDADDAYATSSGTSFSCPTISGLLGLCLTANPGIGRGDALACLYDNSFDVDDAGNAYGNGDAYVDKLGAGVPDAPAVVRCCAFGAPSPAPSVTFAPTTASPSAGPTVSLPPTPFGCGLCDVEGTLGIKADQYYGETAWSLAMKDPANCRNDASTQANVPGPGNEWHYFPLTTLCDGREYTLTVTDSYGDGFCCTFGDGELELIVGGEVLWTLAGQAANFGNTISKTFTAGGAGPAPTASPTSSCADDETWYAKKETKTCDYIFKKNEKAKWDEKKAGKNCKKKDANKVKAKKACKCDACDKSRFKDDALDEASVIIIVPLCLLSAILLGVGYYFYKRRTDDTQLKISHHHRESVVSALEGSPLDSPPSSVRSGGN